MTNKLNRDELTEAFAVLSAQTEQYLDDHERGLAAHLGGPALPGDEAICHWRPAEAGRPLGTLLAGLAEIERRRGGHELGSSKYFAYTPGGGMPSAAFADFLAALFNRFPGYAAISPVSASLENAFVGWLCETFLPQSADAWGTLTSGGVTANFLAICAAREALLDEKASARPVLYVTADTHFCVDLGLRLSGLGRCVDVHHVPLDRGRKLTGAALRAAVERDVAEGKKPWMVVATVGTTITGAVDEAHEIAHVARAHGMWTHVDAAYGGFFGLLPERQDLRRMLSAADSITLDPHKSLFLPFGSGALILRDGAVLRRAIAKDGAILAEIQDYSNSSPAEFTFENSRSSRGMRLYVALQHLGLGALRELLREKLAAAQALRDGLAQLPGIEVAPFRDLSVVLFRAKDDAATESLLDRLQSDGGFMLNKVNIDGRTYARACILGYRTGLASVTQLCEAVGRL